MDSTESEELPRVSKITVVIFYASLGVENILLLFVIFCSILNSHSDVDPFSTDFLVYNAASPLP